MDEQRNVDLIQKMYDAFAKGDIQTIVDHLTDDVEWIAEGPSSVAYFGKMKGPAEVQSKFFGGLATTQENQKLTITDYIAQGDGVATFGRYSATVKATAKKFDAAVGHLFRIRNGKVSKFVNLGDTAAVAEAYSGAAAAAKR
jgi:ketosteroid isomerase-like protein